MKRLYVLLGSLFLILSAASNVSAMEANTISVTILYDNYIFTENLKAEWGFSCLIEGTEKAILFDTGRAKDIFDYNISRIKPELSNVEQVVISHNHSDHTGNLFNFLKEHYKVAVYLPASFPKPFVGMVEKTKAKVISTDTTVEIGKDAFLTGEMGGIEQSLIIITGEGLLIIVGCAHPGIVNIVSKAKEITGKDVYLVMGGFHLLEDPEDKVETVIGQLKSLGVLKVGPTHCTGDNAIALFKKAYGDNFVQMGVGKVISVNRAN